MTFTVGQRVSTLINLESADWDPEQPDIPTGAIGTVDAVFRDQFTQKVMSYGVLLDGDVHRLGVSMAPGEIEAV